MKKKTLKILLCLLAIAAVAPDYQAIGQDKKGLTRSIIINNGDTTVNGKKFSELDKNQRAKLREEFKEMEKNFRETSSLRSRENEVLVRQGRENNEDIVISREGNEPNILFWNDDIRDNRRSFNFNNKTPGDLRVFRFDGDSSKNLRGDLQVSSFGGDSSMKLIFNADSLLKGFNFKMDGLDSNLRKRVITMHREMAPGRPGGMTLRGEGPAFEFERRVFPGMMERNNSSTFNYNHTDKDGISSRISIRIGDASKKQLKKITGA